MILRKNHDQENFPGINQSAREIWHIRPVQNTNENDKSNADNME